MKFYGVIWDTVLRVLGSQFFFSILCLILDWATSERIIDSNDQRCGSNRLYKYKLLWLSLLIEVKYSLFTQIWLILFNTHSAARPFHSIEYKNENISLSFLHFFLQWKKTDQRLRTNHNIAGLIKLFVDGEELSSKLYGSKNTFIYVMKIWFVAHNESTNNIKHTCHQIQHMKGQKWNKIYLFVCLRKEKFHKS